MKKNMRKLTGLLLALVLAVGIMPPLEARAAETVTDATELMAALADNTVDTILVANDIELTDADMSSGSLGVSRVLTIKSADASSIKTISLENPSNFGGTLFAIDGNTDGELILKNITIDGNGNESVSLVIVTTGGTLTLNSGATLTGAMGNGSAKGVDVDGGTLTMNGDSRIRDVACVDKGAVYVHDSGAVIMNDSSRISDCVLAYGKGGGVHLDGGSLTMNGSSSISNCKVASISSMNGNGGGVYVQNGSLTMNDSSSILGCQSTDNGGGVYVDGSSTMEMNDGSSVANCSSKNTDTAGYGKGGGVYVDGGGLTMNDDSSIANCSSESTGTNGSGYGGGVYLINSGSLIMNGSSITSCAVNGSGDGGGVCVASGGRLAIDGGSVTGCIANSGNGPGIYAAADVIATGSCNLQGVYLEENVVIDFGGALAPDAQITIPVMSNRPSLNSPSPKNNPAIRDAVAINAKPEDSFCIGAFGAEFPLKTKQSWGTYTLGFRINSSRIVLTKRYIDPLWVQYDLAQPQDLLFAYKDENGAATYEANLAVHVGAQRLSDGDCTIASNSLTLTKAFLGTLPVEEYSMIVRDLDEDNPEVFVAKITVVDSTAPYTSNPRPKGSSDDDGPAAVIKGGLTVTGSTGAGGGTVTDGGIWTGGDLAFTATAEGLTPSRLERVFVDLDELDRAHYTVKSGSVIVTLGESYLRTLAPGEHVLTLEFKDRIGSCIFRVGAQALPLPAPIPEATGEINFNPNTGL